jgi:hypothetical protein
MAKVVIGIVAVVVLWPLFALYHLFGPWPLLVLSAIAAVGLFAWTTGDA